MLHNLLANARQAIAEGDPEGEIRVEVARRGPWVEVVVEDTGPGLAPDVAAAIFRPFFTTRMPGDGAVESSGRSVLAKPFTLEALRDALAAVAARTGADGGA